jgi:hypothetical protein
VSELTAEHASRRQLRREPALDHRTPPRDGCPAKQIAGSPGSAYEIRHIAPRILVGLFAIAHSRNFLLRHSGDLCVGVHKADYCYSGLTPRRGPRWRGRRR